MPSRRAVVVSLARRYERSRLDREYVSGPASFTQLLPAAVVRLRVLMRI